MSTSNTSANLIERANMMVSNGMDYANIDGGLLLCSFDDGVYLCDPCDQIEMDNFKRIELILTF